MSEQSPEPTRWHGEQFDPDPGTGLLLPSDLEPIEEPEDPAPEPAAPTPPAIPNLFPDGNPLPYTTDNPTRPRPKPRQVDSTATLAGITKPPSEN